MLKRSKLKNLISKKGGYNVETARPKLEFQSDEGSHPRGDSLTLRPAIHPFARATGVISLLNTGAVFCETELTGNAKLTQYCISPNWNSALPFRVRRIRQASIQIFVLHTESSVERD